MPPPPGTPPKSIFSTAQARVPVCYDISRYLMDKFFDIVWGCHPPQMDPSKINFLNGSTSGAVFFDISRDSTEKYLDIVWGATPPGNPPNEPLKNQFFEWLNLGCQSVLISGDI